MIQYNKYTRLGKSYLLQVFDDAQRPYECRTILPRLLGMQAGQESKEKPGAAQFKMHMDFFGKFPILDYRYYQWLYSRENSSAAPVTLPFKPIIDAADSHTGKAKVIAENKTALPQSHITGNELENAIDKRRNKGLDWGKNDTRHSSEGENEAYAESNSGHGKTEQKKRANLDSRTNIDLVQIPEPISRTVEYELLASTAEPTISKKELTNKSSSYSNDNDESKHEEMTTKMTGKSTMRSQVSKVSQQKSCGKKLHERHITEVAIPDDLMQRLETVSSHPDRRNGEEKKLTGTPIKDTPVENFIHQLSRQLELTNFANNTQIKESFEAVSKRVSRVTRKIEQDPFPKVDSVAWDKVVGHRGDDQKNGKSPSNVTEEVNRMRLLINKRKKEAKEPLPNTSSKRVTRSDKASLNISGAAVFWDRVGLGHLPLRMYR